jgi:amino acid adenylation domain-containing protein
METVTEFLKTLASKGVKLSAEAGQLNCYAPNGALTGELRKGILRYKAEILALLDGLDRRPAPRVAPVVREFPLSAGQKGLYILQKINPEMTAYNLPLCIRLRGDVDVALLQKSWASVLDQYPILTARIVESGGTLSHFLDERCRTSIEQQTIDTPDLIAFLRGRVKQPFDLDRGPLARVELFTVAEREHVLLLTIHHMIFDGVSAVVLLRALIANYQTLSEGRTVGTADAGGYHEFVSWEEQMLASADGESHAAYWQQRLSGELPTIDLFPELPRKAAPSFEGASVVETLPPDVSQAIRAFARAHSILPSVAFLAAFKLLLHRYTSLDDLIVGMPVIVRPGQKFAGEIGYFINMVPLRTRLAGSNTLAEFLRSVQSTMLEGISHANYPFELMLDKLRNKQGTKNAVFQVNYAYQNFISDASFAALSKSNAIEVENISEVGPEGYSDLGLEIFEKEAVFSIHVRYNPDLYPEEAIRRFCTHYSTLLQNLAAGGNRALHEYSILPDSERQQVLFAFNDTRAEFPSETCIHDFFAEQVAIAPDHAAVTYGDETLTYRELYERCNALALYLQSLGTKPDSIVGLCLERSNEMMLGIMATVMAGGAYLPLDPDYPDDRLTYMLQDSNVSVVLTQSRFKDRVLALVPANVTVRCLDTEWSEVEARAAALRAEGIALRRDVTAGNLAYVIYTSGSTGKPKGALLEHRALVNRIHWMQKEYQLGPRDVVLQKTPYSFDVSVWEFFWPMMTGASVVFAMPDGHKDVQYLQSLIDRTGVTTLHFVPSMLRAYLDHAETACASVRQIFASGEALDKASVDRYRAQFPNALLHNLYGPTEAAIDVTYYDCSKLEHSFVPIGRPIDNIQLYVLDPHNQPQPVGVPGELHIAGVGLARGYLNRPELTREKFVANPFEAGARMYKTGDLACWMPDGNIQYLGRIDTQVKIRGFRVEIGEIEARLNQYSGILDSAVIAKGEGSDKQLIAFYRAKESSGESLVQLPAGEMRAHLLQTLPEFMVPSAFVSVAAIPLSSNGKVDRRALSRMEVTLASTQEYLAPRNDAERKLTNIWAQILGIEPDTIGVNDNFFEIGGHSLRAAQLIARIRAELGVDIPLKAFFSAGTVAQMARFAGTADASETRVIERVDRTKLDRLPLSYAQERLWFMHQLEPDSAGYNLPGAVTVRGPLDSDQLERAFNLIIARHESLRTVFASENGRARQRILDRLDFRLDRIDLSDRAEPHAEALRICRDDAAAPFDLAHGPLIRAKVLRIAAGEHVLMLNMHHIISDGWSIGVLINELRAIMEAYRDGREPELAPLPIQYLDYSIWQREWLQQDGVLDKQLAYWQQKLAGLPESLDLATDFPRPGVQSFAGATQRFAWDAQLTAQLRRLAEQRGGTLYMALLAACNVLLHRYSGQQDICIGSPIANRQYGQTDGLIGMFVNTLALRNQIAPEDSFVAFFDRVRTTCLEAYENQDAPFEKLVDLVRPQRNLAISPLFQIMLVLQNVDMGAPDAAIERYAVDSGISKFDLTFEFTETPEGLTGSVEYCTSLYKPQTIDRMIAHLELLCRAIVSAPDAEVREFDFIGAAERQRLLVDFNDTRAAYPVDACLHDLFIAKVAEHANDVAVVCGAEQLTYEQLFTRSRDLALYLQSQGVEPDRLVGLCMDRTLDMIAGMLGILQAGGAYVPLDPNYPDDRLAYMVRDSQAAVVLTQESLEANLRSLLPAGTQVIALDRQWAEIDAHVAALKASGIELQTFVTPHHLSHVIYTSGSTGNPKGVAIEHHSPVTLVHWASEVYSKEELRGVLAATSICFDLSVYEIFVTLANGGTIYLVPNALGLVDLAQRDRVTLINTVPSAGEELVRLSAIPDSVLTINLAGEPLSRLLVDKLYDTTRVRKVYDLYGPSEDTTYSTYTLRKKNAPATIGRPIANTQVYILDAQGKLQPIGVPGELHISGDGLAREYLNRPELTREKFVANPFEPGTRMYKTGDLARWLDDGTIQYHGRIDTQVKVRGFRIEMGEIEARLAEFAGIQDAAVIAQGEGANKQLVAFYRSKDGAPLSNDELRGHLGRTLPEYMIPAAFVSLPAIPLNPNGKVDRRALMKMDVAMTSGRAYVAPRNDSERRLAAVWAEVLNRPAESIGIHDDFFELGGHSLLATQLISKIRSEFEIDLPLKTLFERTNVAALAELIAATAKSDLPEIRRVDRTQYESLPLSFAQERLWFIHQLEPDSAGYNVPAAVLVRGSLNVDVLEEAFRRVIARHESLRTIFPNVGGQARQQILDRAGFTVNRIDLRGHADAEAEARRICRADASTPFDLANGPLLRAKAIRIADDQHILLLNMHHIVSDGWSIGVLIREIGIMMDALQRGEEPALAPLPVQYADYSVWQREWLAGGGHLDRQLAYWQKKLAGLPESLDLATDHPRPSMQSFAGATHAFRIDRELSTQLEQLATREGGTLYMVLLAAFKTLLHRYTGQSDICVGSPIANRNYGETEGLIGMFVNTLALRDHVESGQTFVELLSRVKETCLEAYEHQDAPFEKIVDLVHPQRNLAVSPLFQVMLILQNLGLGALDSRMERYALDTGISKFDLSVEFTETPDGLAGVIEYSTALYKGETIERLASHFTALCRAIVETPTAELRRLDFLGDAEKHRLLVEFNATQADYPQNELMHQLFVEQAAREPANVAVLCGTAEVTYAQLLETSSALALDLQAQGIGPDRLVGICMDRSIDMIASMLGVLQAGGAYVPLDPNYPDERLAYMVRDSRAAIVLTQESLVEKLRGLMPEGTQLIALDAQWPAIRERVAALRASGVFLQHDVRPDHLAYVIYTSGSTGNPKGVAIEHHSPVTLIHWAQDVYSREELSGVLAATSICFDLSIYEIFLTLATGGTILLVPNALGLAGLAQRDRVTLINTVPSAAEELVRLGAIPDSVRTINLAGEPLPTRLVDKIYETTSVEKVFDLYGPSEDTTYSTYTLREKHAPATIGRPIANTQVYILDANQQLQPIGVPGELCISGDGLCRGYLYRPELTAEKFVTNPFAPETRMYKTGDLARWLDDGRIQYLGRIDTQVKIRGFRIEIGEIEARLSSFPAIQDCAVIAQGEGGARQLIAFYRAKETTETEIAHVPVDELRAHLLKTLPEYMVPAAFVSLAAIPLNPNGKVDRRALSRIDVTISAGRQYVAPRNESEARLAEIWSQVLDVPAAQIGIHDGFFELGGHSLLATQLMSKIRAQFEVELPLKTLFERGSIAQLAEAVGEGGRSEMPRIVAVDRSAIGRIPLSFAQERVWFIHQLEPDSVAYNLPEAVLLRGEVDVDRIEHAFRQIIARHESLRTVFPAADGQAQQRVLESIDFAIERVDLRHYADPEAEAKRLCQTDATTPFDLAAGPLLRVTMFRLADDRHLLMLNMHHIISDGWSFGILIRELRAILEGRQDELPPLPVQYADYSVWQRSHLEGSGALDRQLAYWQEKLAGVPDSLDLPSDRPRAGAQSVAGAIETFTLDASLTKQLATLAERHGATLYMILMAAFKTLLYRYTGQSDLCVGTPIANRTSAEVEGLVGMFVNTLALRTQIERGDSVSTLVEKVKTTCLEAYEHQDAPFEKVVDALHVQRQLGITPLFQVMLILQNADLGALDPTLERYPLESGVSKFDLVLEFTETADGLAASVRYRTALFDAESIERMAAHFASVCRAMTDAPSVPIAELDYLSDAELHTLLNRFNETQAEFPKNRCLPHLFAEQVAMHPETTAVVFDGQQLTYQELYQKSCDLAVYLRAHGVRPDTIVGLHVDRSLDMIVSLMGILQAGGAYLPLDPDYPSERLQYMLEDARPVLVLTQASLEASLPQTSVPVIVLDRQWSAIEEHARTHGDIASIDVLPEHLAYVIYTSGSTGLPKGVMIEHGSLANYLTWITGFLAAEGVDRLPAITNLGFDASLKQIFGPLMTGRTVVLLRSVVSDPEAVLSALETGNGTALNCVPSVWRSLLELIEKRPEGQYRNLKCLLLGGEEIPRELIRRSLHVLPELKFTNLYGPTEITANATFARRVSIDDVTIGRPIANTQIYILDANRRPVPAGVPGEMYVGGAGVARGYLHRAELTAERFVANPFVPGTRMYKTGDVARWRADGNIEYRGRNDEQVKLRGQRIELGEIETRLAEYPAVNEAVVIAREDEPGEKRLVAYVTTSTPVTADELRTHLLARLPQFMVPSAFVVLDSLPLGANRKVDRKALPKPEAQNYGTRHYEAPRGTTEETVAAIWQELLHVPHPSRYDNFFELGGHSLLATQLISRIRIALGVELPLRTLFERNTLAELADAIQRAAKSDVPPILRVDRSQYEPLPLSFAQERLWFLNELESQSAGYNVPAAVRIRGAFDVAQLEAALRQIIARHETLRTVFPAQDGRAHQRILDELPFALARVDLRHDADRETEAKRICQADAATPFDLANGPLLRGTVIQQAEEEHILLLTMHHIISDGWSMSVLIAELAAIMDALRDGREPELAPLPVQYADYSVWQREWLEAGGVLQKQLAYWQRKLGSVPESLDLPFDFPRPAQQTYAGATHAFSLDAAVTAQLKRIADAQGATLYMVLLAAFDVLLYRYSAQNDICIGTPIANRHYGETEGLIGMFVNTLALRNRVEDDDTFVTLLQKVKTTCLEAYEHQDAPFEKIVDALRLQRNLAISPLFQVMVILQNIERRASDAAIEPYPLDLQAAKFDITAEFAETGDELTASIRYRTALFAPQTISRMAEHFRALCNALSANPDAGIGAVEYLGEAEKKALLVDSNATAAEYPADRCLHELFAKQVALHPDRAAVVVGDRQLTYRELDQKSRTLASYLRANGVVADSRVGLFVDRSLEMVAGIVGTLQAAGAYVPLDPDYPAERLQYMIEDAAPALVLTQAHLKHRLPQTGVPVIAIDSDWTTIEEVARANADLPTVNVTPHHLAYVIYTSGSTGQPKGVMVRQGGVVNLWNALEAAVYGDGDWTRVSVNASFSFDSSVKQFVQLLSGRTLVLIPQDVRLDAPALIDYLAAQRVDVFDCTPSQLTAMLDASLFDRDTPKAFLIGGEAIDAALWRRLAARTDVAFFNVYGPAECTVDATVARITQADVLPHIGRPVANARIYILDRRGNPVPAGVAGEICIGGAGVARGYLNRPELTAERFVRDPFSGEPDARLYKTGDLGRWRAGNIEFSGRNDDQVKLRGQRIELGEIEAQLERHSAIRQAVVVAREDEPGEKRLVAYVIADELNIEDLRTSLLTRLPQYMVPSAFVQLETMPLTPNRKIDRKALPKPEADAYARKQYEAPRGDIEENLAAIWQDLLRVERVGRHDDFFDLGGHSLSAVQLLAKINTRFGKSLPLSVLFTSPNIAAFAALIERADERTFDLLIAVQPNGGARRIFAIPGAGGNVLSLRPLAKAFGDEQPLFAFQSAGLDGHGTPHLSIEETAQAYVDAMTKAQPDGPYRLAGHSYGGAVAFAMARLLQDRGEEIESLVLLDSLAPAVLQSLPATDEAAELAGAANAIAEVHGETLHLDPEQGTHLTGDERIAVIVAALQERGIEIDATQFAAYFRVYRAQQRNYRQYTPSALSRDVDVTLYRATRGHSDLPRDYGWTALLQRAPQVIDVDADHVSILARAPLREVESSAVSAT